MWTKTRVEKFFTFANLFEAVKVKAVPYIFMGNCIGHKGHHKVIDPMISKLSKLKFKKVLFPSKPK